jgi:hypothetical protein
MKSNFLPAEFSRQAVKKVLRRKKNIKEKKMKKIIYIIFLIIIVNNSLFAGPRNKYGLSSARELLIPVGSSVQ